jgi:hypothetical protein
MHSAVLQNKKYIGFSRKGTVEVLSLSSLDRGIEAGDPKAGTYKAKDEDGNEVEYLLSWPGLTVEDVTKIRESPAPRYNKSGKIPYTTIVDPYTLEEIEGWVGGQSANTIMDAAVKATRLLQKEHGKGLSRDEIDKVDEAVAKATELSSEMDFDKALSLLDQVAKKGNDWPETLTRKIEKAHERVIRNAEKALQAFELDAKLDPDKVKKELGRVRRKFKGTGFENWVEQILASVSS